MHLKNRFIVIVFVLAAYAQAQDYSLQDLETFVRSRFEPVEESPALPGCGFSRMLDLRLHWRELSPDLQTKARQLLKAAAPVRQKQMTSPDGHFVVHYDTSGYNAVPLSDRDGNGIPDYIDSAAVILDSVWQQEIDVLGFQAPPDKQGNPVSAYPVYFTRMYDYGVTWLVDEGNIGGRRIFTSYLELNTSYSGFYTKGLNGLRVTAAHEFNHAIQLGYNIWIGTDYDLKDRYFMEMTSTWIEDYVYPEINDYYQYLYFLFDNLSSYSFTSTFSLYPYANTLYLHMEANLHNSSFVVDVWEQIKKENSIRALETILKTRGDSFAQSLNRYGVWLYFTGDRAIPGSYFPDAADYPMLEPSVKERRFITTLPGYGLNLFEINVSDNRVYKAGVAGDSGEGRVNHILQKNAFGEAVAFGRSQIFEYNTTMPNPVAVICNVSEQKTDSVRYNMQAVSLPPAPNPVVLSMGQERIVFKSLPQNSEIRIYSILGRLVARFSNGASNEVSWNMRSANGQPVASGIYLYLIDTGSQILNGKFTVLR